jgi:AcrR family transcriptional regulator
MGRPKSFIREEVIEQAMETFWLKGYAATSLSDLTEVTGLNKKSIYNEFGSKQELFNLALEQYNRSKEKQIASLLKEPMGKQNVISYLNLIGKDTDKRGCLLALSINESESLEQDAKLGVKKDFKGLKDLIYKNLRVDFKESRAQSLSLLVSSMMFSTAGLGKLRTSKKEVESMLNEIINLLD